MSKVAVIAVGGNSLILDNTKTRLEDQYLAVVQTCRHVVDLIQGGWTVILSHGNGPQVGFILQRSELARGKVHPIPMDIAVADTQGSIGYHFQQCMQNEFRQRGMANQAVTVVTQVLVDEGDPAFANPSKPIGGFMDEATARERERTDGWQVVEDSGRGWRRVVASPKPKQIVEFDAIQHLVHNGFSVIAAGGGGVPVVQGEDGLHGAAAVIDKDLASSLMARHIRADLFIISTSVECVCIRFGKPDQLALRHLSLGEGKQYLEEGHFAAGSMKPKVEAALAFVEATGGRAVITNPENISRAVAGECGTEIS